MEEVLKLKKSDVSLVDIHDLASLFLHLGHKYMRLQLVFIFYK